MIELRTVYGVGFIGNGVNCCSASGQHTKSYSTWKEMIRRCYSGAFHIKNPTYKDCTVCDEWHDFQNFANWFEDNYPKGVVLYQLDKDIKLKGNKVYSPATCLFVTKGDNSKHAAGTFGKSWLIRSKNGTLHYITSQSSFVGDNNINKGNFSAMLRGKRARCEGFTLVSAHKLGN